MSTFSKAVILGLILFSVVSVFLSIPSEEYYRTGADEGTYYRMASIVSRQGVWGIEDIGREYLKSEQAKLQPSPLRVGHILMTALWFNIFPQTYVSLAHYSFTCFIVFIAISFLFARKHFGEDVAYFFALLISSSPLMMAMGRRALSDMPGNLWYGLVIWLFLDYLRDKSNVTYGLLLVVFSIAILARESALMVWPFLVVMFLVSKYLYKNDLPVSSLVGIVVVPAFMVFTVYAVLFGGIVETFRLLSSVFMLHGDSAAQTSKFSIVFCSGPWFRYLIDFIVLSPWTLLLFLAFVGHKLISRDLMWNEVYFAGYFAWIFFVHTCVVYFKDVRLIINLDMVISLFSVLCLMELFRQKKSENRLLLMMGSVTVIFFINYSNFLEVFYGKDVYDPISYALLAAKKIVPLF